MADSRFFSSAGPMSLAELAKIAGAELKPASAGGHLIRDVAPLETAGPDDVSFLDNRRYLPAFAATKAGACLVDPGYAERAPADTALLLTSRPYRGYALVARAFYPAATPMPGHHPTAVVDPSARIGEGCTLQPYAVIGRNVEIGARCRIGSHAVIEPGVVIGEATEVGAHAWLSHCLIGRRCLLHPGVRIGSRGFGFTLDPEGYLDVPQLGRVIVEDEVEIGANSTIDRGAGPDTVIGAGSKIDNLVQIGHNVRLGRGCVLVAQSGIAGSTRLDDHVLVAAQAGVAGHLSIGKGAKVIAAAGVMRDVPPGETVGGAPAMPIKEFWRLVTLWQRQLKARGKINE